MDDKQIQYITRKIEESLNKKFADQEKGIGARFDEQEVRINQRFDEQEVRINQRFDEQEKKLEKTIDEKFDERFIPLFNQGFMELVVPSLEELEEQMGGGFSKIDAKLDNINRRLDNDATQLNNYEERLKKIEAKRIVA